MPFPFRAGATTPPTQEVICRLGAAPDSGVFGVCAPNYPGYAPKFNWATVWGTINSDQQPATGVIFRASEVSTALIKDGLSNTYMIGERYLCPDCYYLGVCCDDDQGWSKGYDVRQLPLDGIGVLLQL